MNPHSRLFLILVITLSSFHTALSLKALQYGNEVKDMYSVTGTCFVNEANTWSASGKLSTAVNVYNDNCSGYGIVGGYGILSGYGSYFYKQYTGLPTHTMIYFTLNIYAIDSWDYTAGVPTADDHFGLQFDSTAIDGYRFSAYRFYENLCGLSNWNDLRSIRVFGRVAHTGGSLTLRVVHLLDQVSTDESVGFREVSLIFSNVSPVLSTTMCGTAPFKGFSSGECTCPEGQYYGPSGCTNCHANCESCWGASASECYQCRPGTSWLSGACTACSTGCASCHGTTDTDCDACLTGYYFFNSQSCIYPCVSPLVAGTTTCTVTTCSSPCTTITDYYYWDGTCSSTCDFPYRQNTLNKYVKTCEFPCAAGSFLYWDGSCSTSCLAPNTMRTTKGQNFCDFPCSDDTKIAYWNGTCNTYCLPPFIMNTTNGRQFCWYPCSSTQYLYWNGSCVDTCDFPLSTRTISGDKYCDYPCKNSEFLYWDASCESDCSSLLYVRVEGTPRSRNYCDWLGAITDFLYWDGTYQASCPTLYTHLTYKGRNICNYPCSSTQFLYWNGSCLDSCDLPLEQQLVSSGIQYCLFRCTNSDDYLYWDNSCASTCDYPLTSSTVGGSVPRKECNYPCLSTEVLYYNGTCGSSCLSPFTSGTIGGYTTCQYPCDYTEFLFYNGSCKDNCPFPYALRKTNGLGFCDYPCNSTQYLFWNGTCMNSCDSPLRTSNGPDGEQYCNLPCDSPLDYYYIATGECSSTCEDRSIKENDLYLMCLPPDAPVEAQGFLDLMLTPKAGPDSPSLLVINRYTQYLRYMDVSLPNRLQTLSLSRARNVISLKMNVKMPSGLSSWFNDRSLSTAADIEGVNPSFVINFFGDLVLLFSVAIAAVLFQLIELISGKLGHMRAHAFFEKLRLLTMWNLCFGLIALNADDIIIYTYFELNDVSFTTPSGSVSLIVAVLMVVLALGVVILALYVVLRFRAVRKETINNKGDPKCTEFHGGWKRFQVLYRGYVETSFLKQSFYIMYILRTIIPQVIIIGFVDSPKIQTIAQIACSGVMLAYLLLLKPIKKKVNLVQVICFEAASLAINIAAFIMVTIPASSDGTLSSSHARTFLGDLIILGGLFVNVVIVVFLVLKLVLATYELYNHFKANPNADKTVWLGLLVIPLQQAAFGFEEFMGENLLDIDPAKVNNPYGKCSVVFPDMPSPPMSNTNKMQDPPLEALALEKNTEEIATSPGLPKSTINNIQRIKRLTQKKPEEGTLADLRESGNASPGFELNVSPEHSGIGTSFGLSPTKSSQLLNGPSHHFDFDAKDDSPVRKRATRLQTLKQLTKK